MTDKEKLDKLVAEIKRLRKEVKDNIAELGNSESERIGLFKDLEIYDNILSFIDSMQKEPESEEFEKALAEEWQGYIDRGAATVDALEDNTQELAFAKGFYRGANWQKEQMMAEAFDFTKEHNTACILASECLRNHGWFNRERDFNDLFRHLACVDKLFEGKFSGKTKVIVIKEE